jgi:outer membrane protein assembly factor BamB
MMLSRSLLGLGIGITLLLTATAGAFQPNASGASSWPQFHGDPLLDGATAAAAPGGVVRYTSDLARYVGGSVSNPLGNDFPYQASPSTDGTLLYVALDNTVLALTANTGTFQWQASLPGGSGSGPAVGTPLVANGLVYVSQDGGPNQLVALHANNGTQAWSATPPGGGNPASASVVESDGILALADTSGGFFWTAPTGGGAWTSPPVPPRAQYVATPSFGTISGVGPAWVEPDRGNRSLDAWSSSGATLPGFPVASGQPLDRLYSSAALVNLSMPTGGTATWAFFGGEGGQGNPSHLYAVDVSQPSGVRALVIPAPGTGDSGVRSTPAVVASGGTASLFFGGRTGSVSLVDFDPGSNLRGGWSWIWNATTGGPVDASPVVVGGEVIAPSEDGSVYAFTTGTGVQLWKVATGAPLYGSPALANGLCWVINANGVVTAIGGVGPGPGGSPPPAGPLGTASDAFLWLGLLIVGIIAVSVVVVILVVLSRRRPRPPTPNPRPTPPPPPSGGWQPPPPP